MKRKAFLGSLAGFFFLDDEAGAMNISITIPGDGSALRGTIPVTVLAAPLKNLQRVSLEVDGVLLGSDTADPFVFSWDTTQVADGSHTLHATAYYKQRESEASLQVAVANATAPPPPPPPSGEPIPSDGIIRSGGMYTGVRDGSLEIATTSPVTISAEINYTGGTLIKTRTSAIPDLTLDHCKITGGSHRILDADAFKRIVLTNCSIEKTAGVTLVGNGDVTFLRNRHHNIQRVVGGVGNFLQVRLWTAGTFEVGWNEIINEYNLSNPEDLFSIYHSSNTYWHDNYLRGQFHPDNGPGSSQNGITLDGYGGSGQPVDNNRIEDNILVRTLSIAVFPTSTGPARGNRFLRNRVVNAGFLDDGVTRNYYGYQGMSVKPGGTDNQAHGNVLGTMKGTSQGSGRGNDGEFSGEPRGNGNGIDTGAWVDNTHMAPLGGTITRAMEDAEWTRWQSKLAAAGIVVGA